MFSERGMKMLRRNAERTMDDTIRVMRPSDSTLESDLTETNVPGVQVYEGKARITPTRGPREASVGEGVMALRDADIIIPHDSPLVWRDDNVEVVTSADPALEGRSFRVTDVRVHSEQAARRFSCVQVQPSRQWQPSG